MGKFVVFTGLDGSGTSSVAAFLSNQDTISKLFKSPPPEFSDFRKFMDEKVREVSKESHYLFYLLSNVFLSKQIENFMKTSDANVYCVRYFVDTVVSQKVAGLPIDLNYETELYKIKKPDLIVFLEVDENERQRRLEIRGKGFLDRELDDDKLRKRFVNQFKELDEQMVRINTTGKTIEEIAEEVQHLIGNL